VYKRQVDAFVDVRFDAVATRCLRAVLTASGQGTEHAALAVEEWEALTPQPVAPATLPAPPAIRAGCPAN